jgi:hypothetical protein
VANNVSDCDIWYDDGEQYRKCCLTHGRCPDGLIICLLTGSKFRHRMDNLMVQARTDLGRTESTKVTNAVNAAA